MDTDQLGQTRTEQDVIVNSARDASTAGITSWRVDVPGGRVFTVPIDVDALYVSVFELIEPIMSIRLHRVKRVTDANLNNEIRDHTAAVATYFCKCCYQQMREAASLRFSPIVQDRMNLDLYLARASLPRPLARMVAGFGPIFVGDGHLKRTTLVPYLSPGTGDLNFTANQAHPWIESSTILLTAMTAFRIPPEIHVTDVDFTSTQGSAFWTIWTTSSTTEHTFEGFCSLPEPHNTDVDKLLAAIIRRPLFSWPSTPIIPIDWSSREFDVPAAWAHRQLRDIIYGREVTSQNIYYRGDRQFYNACELLIAQIVSRPDHQLVTVQAPASANQPSSGSTLVSTEGQSSKRPRTEPQPDGSQPAQMLTPCYTYRVRVGYAGFYGSAFDGIEQSTSFQLFFKANALL